MRICIATESTTKLGGVEAIVKSLLSGLAQRNHELLLLSLDSDQQHVTRPDHRVKRVYLHSHQSNMYARRDGQGRLYRGFWLARCARNRNLERQLQENLKSWQPDVIHTHKVRGFPHTLWGVLKRDPAVRLIHTCHDLELLSPLHELSISSGGALRQRVQRFWSKQFAATSEYVDMVTSPSSFLLSKHVEAGLFRSAERRVISNAPEPVDEGSVFPLTGLLPGEPLRVLFMGRLVEAKGVRQLCQAMARVADSGVPVELRVAGDGPLRSWLVQFSERHPWMEYAGNLIGADKHQSLKWAHLAAVPSRLDEAFGLVAAEAVRAGRPALVSARGGLPEVVEDGVTGWLCGDGSIAELESAIRSISAARSELPGFSQRCLQAAKAFSLAGMINQFESAYRANA